MRERERERARERESASGRERERRGYQTVDCGRLSASSNAAWSLII